MPRRGQYHVGKEGIMSCLLQEELAFVSGLELEMPTIGPYD